MLNISKYQQGGLMAPAGGGVGGGAVAAIAGAVGEIVSTALNLASKWTHDTADALLTFIEDFGGDVYLNIEKMQVNAARALGMTYQASSQIFDEYTKLSRTGMGVKFGMNQERLFEMQSQIGKATGRNIQIGKDTGWNLGALNTTIGQENTVELVKQLDIYGQNANDAAQHIEEIYKNAGKYGLSFEEYSEAFMKNLEKAQRYNFKDGLKSLENMAKKATEIKLSIESVSSFAEKMWTGGIEGAIESASKLQVLGGPFAALADPLAILNESLNDFEGLGDRIAGMVENLGTFNRETGEIEVSSYNQARLREAAQAMGMSSPDDLLKMVRTQARRNAISEELNYYTGLSDDLKEKLMNIGTFQRGMAGATIQGKFRTIDEIANSSEFQELLAKESAGEKDTLIDISLDVRSINEKLGNMQRGQNGGMASILKGPLDEGITWFEQHIETQLDEEEFNKMGVEARAAKGGLDKLKGAIGMGKSTVDAIETITKGNGGPIPEFGDGGLVSGPSHRDGGIMASIHNIPSVNLEGGEFIVNKESASQYGNLLKTINDANKPYSNMPSPSGLYGNGGYIATVPQAEFNIGDWITGSIDSGIIDIKPVEDNRPTITSTDHNMTYEKVSYNNETNTTNNRTYSSDDLSKEIKINGELILNIKGDNVVSDTKRLDFINDIWNKLTPTQQSTFVHEIVSISNNLNSGIG